MISYAKYTTKLLFWNVPQGSQFFYLLLEFAQSFYWHEKRKFYRVLDVSQRFQNVLVIEYF